MVLAAGFSGHAALSQKRVQFAGPPGILGLASNIHVLAIAIFASLGGFVYGCMSSHLLMLFILLRKSLRQPRNVWADLKHDRFPEYRASELDLESHY